MLPPLVLTGGPAVGKSATAGHLARSRTRAAVVDVDDLRHLVVAGHVAPWEGAEGARQRRLGVENACLLAARFHAVGIEVVITDVVVAQTQRLYRRWLPGVIVVHLQTSLAEAYRRAALREVHLSDAEFEALHRTSEEHPPAAGHRLDVTTYGLDEQVAAVARLWSRSG